MTTTEDTSTQTGSAAADPFDACLLSMAEALDGVAETPAWVLSEEAVVARLGQALRIRARVEELTSRLLGSVVDREVPRLAGSSSTRAWLMSTGAMSAQDASRLVREAALHGTQDMVEAKTEPTRSAWAAGLMSAEHAVLIGATIDKLSDTVPPAVIARLQGELLGHAQRLSYQEMQTVCRHAAEVVDPEGADKILARQLRAEEERALALCELTMRRSGEGWTAFRGKLPDVHADMLRAALDAYTSPRHQAATRGSNGSATTSESQPGGPFGDPGDAPLSVDAPLSGDAPPSGGRPGPGDPRSFLDPARGVEGADRRMLTYPQRMGRALMDLIEHLPTKALPRHGVASAVVVVTMTLDQLRADCGEAMSSAGTPLSPNQARRFACNGEIIPTVLGGSSAILDVGLARRLFSSAQRVALAVRDRGCIWAGCDRPPAWCEAHHIRRWSEGGPTDLSNGCLLCPFHHHLVHSTAGWSIAVATDGIPEVIPPGRLDPDRVPRRHERFRQPMMC